MKRGVLRGLSGLPVLKEGPELNAAPRPAARAPGGAPREQGLWRSGSEDGGAAGASFPEPDFLLYFPSVASLFAEGAATWRLRDWSVCHHCPSVPCVLCQAPPGHHHQHLPPTCRAGVLPPPAPSSPSQQPPKEGKPAGPVRAAFCHLGRRSSPGPSVTLPSGSQGPAVQLGLQSEGLLTRDLESHLDQLEPSLPPCPGRGLRFRHWQLMKTASSPGGQA